MFGASSCGAQPLSQRFYFFRIRDWVVWDDGVKRKTLSYYNSLYLSESEIKRLSVGGRRSRPSQQPKTKEFMDKVYLSDVSEKDKPWDVHRAQSDQARNLYQDISHKRYAERIHECAEYLLFTLFATDEAQQRFKLQSTRFCRVRHCPVCQWRRSLTWVARFHKALPAILGDYPTAKFVLLTLTVRNCPTTDLRVTLARMNQAFRRLTFRKEWPAMGYIKTFEVTPSRQVQRPRYSKQSVLIESGKLPLLDGSDRLDPDPVARSKQPDATIYDFSYCHPHFHVLLMVPSGYFAGHSYIKQDRWVKLWRECLQVNYDPVVDVRKVGGRKRKSSLEDPQLKQAALIAAIKETIKYTVKPEHLVLDADFLGEITKQLHKTRSISVGGLIRRYISEAEPGDDELIRGDDLLSDEFQASDPKWLFNWGEQEKRYKGGPIA